MFAVQAHPLQQAQIVWQRALALAIPVEKHDPVTRVLELLSAAHYDSTTLAHAAALGRTEIRTNGAAAALERAVRMLDRGVAFLGVKPLADAAVVNPRPRITC